MAVNPNIKKKADAIRTKIYGKEVRESLASGLEAMSSDVVENESRQSVVEGRQDSVESQWQTVSDEMTDKDVISAPEIIAARNGEANLKTRIDKDYQEVTAQLAQNGHDFRLLAGDGVTDDSSALNSIISNAVSKGVTKIILPKASYRIDHPLYILEKDNVELDFNGSDLLSYAEASNGSSLGIINFRGAMPGADLLSYLRSHLSANPAIPSDAPLLHSYEQHVINNENYIGRITTSNNAYFSEGDDVFLRGYTRASGTNYDKDLYEPLMWVVAKVLKVDSEHVYVDYYNPFGNMNFVQGTQPSFAVKLNLAENLKLKNVNIYDMTTVETADGAKPTQNDRNKALTPVSFIGCENVEVENIKMYNFKGNGVRYWFSRNIRERNIEGYKPQLWDGGYGYTTQFNGCRDIVAENIYGEENRHVIDFSFSSHGYVENLKGLNTITSDIDMHGQNEHDIEFKNCEGKLQLGNGIIYYPMMIKNLTFDNCKLRIPSLHLDQVRDTQFIENVTFNNCILNFRHVPPILTFTIRDSIIYWDIFEGGINVINKRGKDFNTFSKFENTTMYLDYSDVQWDTLYLLGHDYTVLDNVTMINATEQPGTTGMFLYVPTNTSINNLRAKNLKFRIDSSRSEIDFKVKDSHIIYDRVTTSVMDWIAVTKLDGATLNIDASNNIIEHTGETVQFRTFYAPAANSIDGSSIYANFGGNKLLGNPKARIHCIYIESDDLTVHFNDYNNLIRDIDPGASNKLSTERNFIV